VFFAMITKLNRETIFSLVVFLQFSVGSSWGLSGTCQMAFLIEF
jgi:hypothetical protein